MPARFRAGEVPQELDPIPLLRRSAAMLRGGVHRRRARGRGPARARFRQWSFARERHWPCIGAQQGRVRHRADDHREQDRDEGVEWDRLAE